MEELRRHYDRMWDAIKQEIKQKALYENYVFDNLFNDTYIADIDNGLITVCCKNFINQALLSDEKNKLNDFINDFFQSDVNYSLNPILESEYQKNIESYAIEENPIFSEWNDSIIPNFTFDNFVVGDSNRQAQAAAVGCAYNPGGYYNPLFIYGDSGLGKTHLLHAIGNYVKKKFPEKRVLYLPTTDLISQYIASTKSDSSLSTQDYMDHLKSVDVLLLDDVQFLSEKPKTNTFFFQVYNSLVSNRKQIVLTSDKSPYEMDTLDIEDRLVSRFSSGLTVTITSPEFNTRLEILRLKAKEQADSQNNPVLDDESLIYIAANSTGDVRKLEGLLNQVLFYQIQFSDLDSKKALKEILKQDISEQKLDSNKIIRCVGDYYHLSKQQLLSKSRSKNIVNARHMSMYLIRKELDEPFNKIGSYFNGCDHTTVMSACKKIENLIKYDTFYQQALHEIEEKMR